MKKLSILFISTMFLMASTHAQQTHSKPSTLAIGTTTGYTMFYGNIQREGILPDQSTSEKDYGTIMGLFLQTTSKEHITYRFYWNKGTLNGVRNTIEADYEVWFNNNFWQTGCAVIFPIINPKHSLNMNGICGVGLINYRSTLRCFECPKTIRVAGYDDNLKPISPRTDATFNLGLEIVYKLSKTIGIRLEYNYHLATSSNLDAVKGKYNDRYSATGIGLLLNIY